MPPDVFVEPGFVDQGFVDEDEDLVQITGPCEAEWASPGPYNATWIVTEYEGSAP